MTEDAGEIPHRGRLIVSGRRSQRQAMRFKTMMSWKPPAVDDRTSSNLGAPALALAVKDGAGIDLPR